MEDNKQWFAILSALPGSIYWKDQGGVYRAANQQAIQKACLNSLDELLGKTDHELFSKRQADVFRENDLWVMQTGKEYTIEEKSYLPSGEELIQLSFKRPLYNDKGENIGVVGNTVDITELKRSQENEKIALQKAAADEATKRAVLIFSGMSTHDLRTPLSLINLKAGILKKYLPLLVETYQAAVAANLNIPSISEKSLEDLQKNPLDIMDSIQKANEYISSSLKSLKGAAEGDNSLNQDNLVTCNVRALLKQVVDNYPYKEGQKNLLHCDTNCDFDFRGDMIFFNRLMENLIKNAFEQIELNGKGEIFIFSFSLSECNVIKIKDTAGGVTQAIIDKLFNGIQSSKIGGTGIGLSSAKQTMQSMGGDIQCGLVDGDCIEFFLNFPKLA
jgi:PAS domain S-box-containing protein